MNKKRCESSFQKIVFYTVLTILHRENISFIIKNSRYKNEHKSDYSKLTQSSLTNKHNQK